MKVGRVSHLKKDVGHIQKQNQEVLVVKESFRLIYQLKITLKGTKPPIWRRIQIPEAYTLWDLHMAIQDAMGWEDSHMHKFQVVNPFGMERITIEAPERDQKVSRWLNLENSHLDYIYDFENHWDHDVEIEWVLPREDNVDYPVCIEGEQNCPPEDCGGAGGYEELLEILKDPSHDDYEEKWKWVEEGFDPEHFKPEEVVFTDHDKPNERFE